MISGKSTGKDVEVSDHGIIQDPIPLLSLRNLENHENDNENSWSQDQELTKEDL
jgi:hypothetical protein